MVTRGAWRAGSRELAVARVGKREKLMAFIVVKFGFWRERCRNLREA
jgi:hypothetical protein